MYELAYSDSDAIKEFIKLNNELRGIEFSYNSANILKIEQIINKKDIIDKKYDIIYLLTIVFQG